LRTNSEAHQLWTNHYARSPNVVQVVSIPGFSGLLNHTRRFGDTFEIKVEQRLVHVSCPVRVVALMASLGKAGRSAVTIGLATRLKISDSLRITGSEPNKCGI